MPRKASSGISLGFVVSDCFFSTEIYSTPDDGSGPLAKLAFEHRPAQSRSILSAFPQRDKRMGWPGGAAIELCRLLLRRPTIGGYAL